MALLSVPADTWVNLPDTGTDQVVEARGRGVYIDTTNSLTFDNRAHATSLPGLHSIVISAAVIAAGVKITSGSVKPASVYHGPL